MRYINHIRPPRANPSQFTTTLNDLISDNQTTDIITNKCHHYCRVSQEQGYRYHNNMVSIIIYHNSKVTVMSYVIH